MRIIIENNASDEIEIVLKGDASSKKMMDLINLLNSVGSDRILKSIIGKKKDREYILSIEDVECFESKNGQTLAKHNSEDYKIRLKLFEVEQLYQRYGFRRISKSVILNCNHIKYIEVEFSGNYRVATKSQEKMTISRRYVSGVKKYIKEEM